MARVATGRQVATSPPLAPSGVRVWGATAVHEFSSTLTPCPTVYPATSPSPTADLVTLLRRLPPDAEVGFKLDFDSYRQSGDRPEPIPITASKLLELLDGWARDIVPIDEHEFSYFAIRVDGPRINLNEWVRVLNTSPLFSELQSRRRGFGQ